MGDNRMRLTSDRMGVAPLSASGGRQSALTAAIVLPGTLSLSLHPIGSRERTALGAPLL